MDKQEGKQIETELSGGGEKSGDKVCPVNRLREKPEQSTFQLVFFFEKLNQMDSIL